MHSIYFLSPLEQFLIIGGWCPNKLVYILGLPGYLDNFFLQCVCMGVIVFYGLLFVAEERVRTYHQVGWMAGRENWVPDEEQIEYNKNPNTEKREMTVVRLLTREQSEVRREVVNWPLPYVPTWKDEDPYIANYNLGVDGHDIEDWRYVPAPTHSWGRHEFIYNKWWHTKKDIQKWYLLQNYMSTPDYWLLAYYMARDPTSPQGIAFREYEDIEYGENTPKTAIADYTWSTASRDSIATQVQDYTVFYGYAHQYIHSRRHYLEIAEEREGNLAEETFIAPKYFLQKMFYFINELVKSQIASVGLLPLISCIFSTILFCNLVGMIPYTMTLTSQIMLTLSMSLFSFLLINLIYIKNEKLGSLQHFLPNGAPLFIVPFLLQIEIISYISRIISLSVRLFANMTSGHTLLKILSSFILALVGMSAWGNIISIAAIFVIFLVTGLEIMIGILQAYVFVVLLLLYINEIEIEH